MNLDGFNAQEVEPRKAFDLLPPGKYKVVISESEEKATKKGDGSYLSLTMTVVEGEHEGRKLFDRLNLNNPTAVAADIARQTLSAICRAVGINTPQHSSELHDVPLVAVVKIVPPKGEYEAKNEVKGYESAGAGGSPAAALTTMGKAKPQPQAGAASAPPWSKKK